MLLRKTHSLRQRVLDVLNHVRIKLYRGLPVCDGTICHRHSIRRKKASLAFVFAIVF